MPFDLKKYREELLKKQLIIQEKIDILQEKYDEIERELDRTATKSRKIQNPSNKGKEEGCCIS